jgi:hypothetical protein
MLLMLLFQLKQKPEFSTLNIAWNALQTAFKRDLTVVLAKFGTSKEQVNLSGLNEMPAEYDWLHLDMAEEDYKESNERKSKSAKVVAQKRLNNVVAEEGLKKQGEINDEKMSNIPYCLIRDNPSCIP